MSGQRRCSEKGCADVVVGRRLCRKHYQAAWKAGTFKTGTRPRRPARTVCPPLHKHGATRVCYVHHHCRCDPCTDANRDQERNRTKLKAYGRYDRGVVPAEPIREHMMALAEFGIGYKQAARLAGLSTTVARTLIWGRQEPGPRYGELQKNIKRENAEKLLAIQPVLANLADGATTPARGTVRRIQTLIACGWSQNRIATELGMLGSNLSTLRLRYENAARRGRGATVRVNAGTARAVAALYDRLASTTPPAYGHREKISVARARNLGVQHKWPLPMDWAAVDDDFDRPFSVKRSAA